MKILQVITSLQTGGAEKLIVDMVPLYSNHGIVVDVLLFDGTDTPFKRKLQEKGIRVFQLGYSSCVYNPLFIFKLIPYLGKYDIVHTHITVCQYFVAFAKFVSRSKVNLVTTEHNTTNRRRSIKGFRIIDKFIYSCYNAIISISHKTTESLQIYIGNKENIFTITNGINLSVFKDAVALNKEFLVWNKSILITMVASFRDKQKDQDTVIRAMSLLPDNYSLCLIGDGIRRTICETLVKELHLEKRVIFLGIRNDVPQLLKTSDIVVMSSHWEGFGLAAVEGMAAGKPVIASDVPGLAQVVGDAGLLFPVGDAKELASVMEHLINDEEYYQQIAQQCLQRASEYDIRNTVSAYEKLYGDLLNNHV